MTADHSEYGNLVISGVGRYAGGKFRKAVIDGTGTIEGDVECESWTSNGVSKVIGSIRTTTASVNGVSSFIGDILGKQITINGVLRIDRNISGEEIRLDGVTKVKGNCQAERLHISGGIKVDGLINAETITLHMTTKCRAKEIGCSTIRVTAKPVSFFQRLFRMFNESFSPHLSVDLIEGDDIDLSHTTAGIVRGNNVRIGPGCSIDKIEYTGNCQIDPAATVKSDEKKG